MQTRPFRVLGIQQVAVGGPDKNRLRTLWVETLGLSLEGQFRSEAENVDEDIAALGRGPFRVEVDLMQPLDPERKPSVHSPAPARSAAQASRRPAPRLPGDPATASTWPRRFL